MFDLTGKLALVTGSSRGIGKQIAIALATAGADVIVHGRTVSGEAEKTAEEIRTLGRNCDILTANMREVNEIEGLFAKIKEKYGKLDILVNNAAVLSRCPFLDLTVNDWDYLMETNSRGYFLATQQAAKLMLPAKSGRIINISSISQYDAAKNRAHYCASKGAIAMLTKCAALELAAYGITVNAVLPGSIHTDFNNDVLSDPAYYERVKNSIPLGRLGKPQDIGGAVAFLASEEASFISGAEIVVDGAMTIY